MVWGQDQGEEPGVMELVRFGWGKGRIYGEIWAELEAMPSLTSRVSGLVGRTTCEKANDTLQSHDSGGRKKLHGELG